MEVASSQPTDANSHNPITSSNSPAAPSSSQTFDPDGAATSPLTKSRYGRTRKPKITEDFYNIDVIFENSRETKKSPRVSPLKSPVPKTIKPLPNLSPQNKPSAALKSPKPNTKPKNFVHVTGDTIMTELPKSNATSSEIKSPAIRKFFKRESIKTPPHNSKEQTTENSSSVQQPEVDACVNSDISALAEESLSLQAVDVTKVLKIISNKTLEPTQNNSDLKGGFKPALKTYSNKRKNIQKPAIVESFGLPDKPIFPLENDKATASNEPKRIKSLDVVAPSSENDINIVDKKLLDTPWKIASMNTDFADSEILSETCADDVQEENKVRDEMESLTIINGSEEIACQTTSLQEIDENMNGDQINPNNTKQVSPKKEISDDLPDKIETSKNKVLIMQETRDVSTNNSVELAVDKEIKIQKIRSPRKQKHIISEEPVITINEVVKNVNIKASPIRTSRKKQKPTPSENNSILETSSENSKKPTEIKAVRNKSPRKGKESSELLEKNEIIPEEKQTVQKSPRKKTKLSQLPMTPDKQIDVEKSPNALLKSVDASSPETLNKSISQKRKRSLSLGKTAVNSVVLTPQRKSLRLQIEPTDNTNKTKLNNTSSPKIPPKIKNTDQTLQKNESELTIEKKVENDQNSHSVTDIKTRSSRLKIELRVKTSINSGDTKTPKNNSPGRHSARQSKIDAEVTTKIEDGCDPKKNEKAETTKARASDIVDITDDLEDEMSLLDRSLCNKSSDGSKTMSKECEILLEIKKEKDIEQENNDNTMQGKSKKNVSKVSPEKSPNKQKEQIVLESGKSLDDLQIKLEPEDVELGDLMWAKIGGHPYWPCVISEDPVLEGYKSAKKHIKNYIMNYHVRFFGDRGRRSWVSHFSLLRFNDKNDLNMLYDKVKLKTHNAAVLQPYTIKPHILPKWENAVSEAESLKSSTVQERFDFFFNMFASDEEKKKRTEKLSVVKNKKMNKTLNASIPSDRELQLSPVKVEGQKSNKTPKINVAEKPTKVLQQTSPQKLDKTPKSRKTEHISPKKVKLEPKSMSQTRSKSLPASAVQSPSESKKDNIKSKAADNLENNKQIFNETDNTLKPPKKGMPRSITKQELEATPKSSITLLKNISKIKKVSRENSFDEPPETFLKNPWQVFDMAKRQLNTPLNEVNSECSLSDTDSHSKSSTNTPIPSTYKDQITRQRRNNLFKGIPRHRVCQVCKKPGEILKCKGPCNGLFHYGCSAIATKDSPTVIIKGEETTDSENDTTTEDVQEDKEIVNKLPNGIPDTDNSEKVSDHAKNSTEIEVNPSDKKQSLNIQPVTPKKIVEDRIKEVPKNNKPIAETSDASNKVEIIHVQCDDSDFEHSLTPKVRLTPNTDFSKLSLAEQIDMKMKEIMQKFEKNTRYADSTTDYTSSEESSSNLLPPDSKPKIVQKKKAPKIKHVTADCVSFIENSSSEELLGEGTSTDTSQVINSSSCSQGVSSTAVSEVTELIVENSEQSTKNGIANIPKNNEQPAEEIHVTADTVVEYEASNDLHSTKEFKCGYCIAEIEPPCAVCSKEVSSKEVSFRQKCSLHMCGKFYHPECLKMWPQTQWSLISTAKHKNSNKRLDTFVCPVHVCHTCASDNPHAAISRCTSDKVVKCLRCPATYHTTNYCVPAGTLILSTSQIVCPRHLGQTKMKKGKVIKFARTINTPWCFICSKGGDLICCETCPTSVHSDCMQINLLDDGAFICEDCETGRFPLYDEIVWVKLGAYRWWPAVILFPNEIPDNVKNITHSKGDFVVKFFGTHDHYWVHRGRVFLFQEGDRGHCSPTRKRVDAIFKKSIEEATAAHHFKKVFKMNQEAEIRTGMKPPPYIRVKVNKPVGNVRLFDGNISNTTSCECDPNQANPCGPDSDCLNRLLLTECDPNICPAKEKCYNQRFEKRQYPPLLAFKTPARGWGLKTLAPIRKGDFVIEYVGEIIDEQEYQRRIHKMHEQKDENYYFLTIDKDRIIDAGPKGNLARFMNHCCQPNCETQKWTVNGDTRVGLFAMEDIASDAELTFNYNLECIGKEKKICKCGAPNCSGFIGVKAKADESQKKPKKSNNSIKKKKQTLTPQVSKSDGPCFICGQHGDVGACHNKICTKFYHLKCVNLEVWPEGKWVCPWHNCDICSKRTIRCCVKCIHSYCPIHSEGNVRYDKLLGFICSDHDPTKELQDVSNENLSIIKKTTPSKVSTTEETDVTSTTPDEIESNPINQISKNIDDDIYTTDSSEIILAESVTSTPIKSKYVTSFVHMMKDYEHPVEIDNPEDSVLDTPEKQPENENPEVPTIGKRKRGRPKKSAGNSPKKIKLSSDVSSEVVIKLKKFSTSNLLDIPAQNEVKLSSSVPARHLRTTRSGVAHTEIKRFLNRQNELEKDLPIRKRSRPRCEASL